MAQSWFHSSFLDTNPRDLNRYIDENLQPNQRFHAECSRNMDFLADYLKNRSNFSVAETIKGGSLGKGTAIKGKSDLDVVMYISSRFHSMRDFLTNIQPVMQELDGEIRRWSREYSGSGQVVLQRTTRYLVKMQIQYSNREGTEALDVDLLPAFDILSEGTNTAYQRMDNLSADEREHFSACLVTLQLEFVRKQPPNVKNLIRLVKHWRKTQFPDEAWGIPTSFVLELLTIYAWERAGSPPHFNTAKAFKAILTILKDYMNIEAFWTDNYNRHSYSNTARKEHGRPFILDPANPFNNVCERFQGWDTVSEVADRSLRRPLLNTVSIQRIGYNTHGYSWN